MEWESNIHEVMTDLSGRLQSLKDNNALIRTVATTLYGNILRRVHNEGKTLNDVSIGNYSTKPILIGAKSFVNKGAAARAFAQIKRDQKAASKVSSGASKWVTIKGRHLAELEGGYKKIREYEGKPISHVNLDRTGTLRKDFGFEAQGNDYVIGFRTEYGKNLRAYMEDHFGKKIWGASKLDQAQAHEIAENAVNKQMK